MNKIFQEHFLDNPAFRLVAILKSINKVFKKQLQRNAFLRYVIQNLSAKSLKNLYQNLYLWTKALKYACEGIHFFSLPYSWLYLWLFICTTLKMFDISFNKPSRNSIIVHLVYNEDKNNLFSLHVYFNLHIYTYIYIYNI